MTDWPLVGRDAELAAVFERLDHDAAASVVIAGAAGDGKSRLAREIADHADERGWSTNMIVGMKAATSILFGAIAPLIDSMEDVPAVELLAQARRVLTVSDGGPTPSSFGAPARPESCHSANNCDVGAPPGGPPRRARCRCEDDTVPEIRTPRLRLVAGTVELFDAELDQPARLTALLDVAEVAEWPPSGSDYDRDAVELFRAQLVAHPSIAGWNSYYVCWGDALVGTGGYFGPPVHGVAEIGYAVCQLWRGRGIATELVGGLVGAAFASGLERLIAHTQPDNAASIKVLTRNLFEEQEPDEDDRLLFVRTLSDPTRFPP